MLHHLGDPPYIQLLVNPETRMVGIKAVNHSSSGDQHKVSKQAMQSDNSIEIYSLSFVTKLKEVSPELNMGHLYRMSGSVIPSVRVAVFDLTTITRCTE